MTENVINCMSDSFYIVSIYDQIHVMATDIPGMITGQTAMRKEQATLTLIL